MQKQTALIITVLICMIAMGTQAPMKLAQASSIFVISGKITTADDQPAKDGLEVYAKNENTGVTGKGITGKMGPGLYSIAIFDPNNLEAETLQGHVITITVEDNQQVVGTITHTVTEAEQSAMAATGVDIKTKPPTGISAQVSPNKLSPDGESQATITVHVVDDSGNPVTGDSLTVKPEFGTVTNIKEEGNGRYTAVYTAPELTESKIDEVELSSDKLDASTIMNIFLEISEVQPGPVANVELTAGSTELIADGESNTKVTARVTDKNDNPIADETVSFSVPTGMGSVTETTYIDDGKYRATYTTPKLESQTQVTITANTKAGISGTVDITLVPETVISKKVLTVSGMVYEADGKSPVPDGIQLKVRIPVRDLTQRTLTQGGKYEVAFPEGSDIRVGDLVKSIAQSSTGDVVYGDSKSYLLTQEDLNEKKITLDVTTNRLSVFSILGKVTKADGETPIVGATVSAEGKSDETDSNGEYELRFTDYATNPTEGSKIEISVTTSEGISKSIESEIDLSTANMIVNISVDITPPEAEAGSDQYVRPNTKLFLDASQSTDNVRIVKYNWDFDASDGIAEDSTGIETSVTYDSPGVYTVTLTVKDSIGNQATDTLDITVDEVAEITAVKVEPKLAGLKRPVSVTVTGEPNAEVIFSIDGIPGATNLKMTETTSGNYEGEYQPRQGDNITEAKINVKFTDRTGNETTDNTQKVSIDTIPPSAPTELKVDDIKPANVDFVDVEGKASPNVEVTVTFTDESDGIIEKRANTNDEGNFKRVVDANSLADGMITVSAYQTQDEAGNPGEALTKTVSKKTTVEPTFQLYSPTPNQEGEAGKTFTYFIEIKGYYGFDSTINLEVTNFPQDMSESDFKFDQTELSITPDETTKTAQLTLELPSEISEGEYTFSVRALAEGSYKELDLSVVVTKTPAYISLSIDPAKPRLYETVEASGSLILPDSDETSAELEFSFGPKDGSIKSQKIKAEGESGELDYTTQFEIDKMKEWNIEINFSGIPTHSAAERSETFTPKKALSQIVVDELGTSIKGEKVKITGRLTPNLEDEGIVVIITNPDGFSEKKDISTEEEGIFEYKKFAPDQAGQWQIKARWAGNDNYESCVSGIQSLQVVKGIGKFILVLGGANEQQNKDWDTFETLANDVYRKLRARTFEDEDIYYLSPSTNPPSQVDATTSMKALEQAINWAKPKVGGEIPLYVYLLSHNYEDKFLLAKEGDKEIILTAKMLDEMLDTLEPDTKVNLMVEACYSGNFITAEDENGLILPADNRTIISSADESHQGVITRGSSFSNMFFSKIRHGRTVKDAFDSTEKLMSKIKIHKNQNPWLNSNNNSIANETVDYTRVEDIYIPHDLVQTPLVPEILNVFAPIEIQKGEGVTLWAELSEIEAERVFATIIPPSYDPTAEFTEMPVFAEMTLSDPDDDKIYEATYDDFEEIGEYQIVLKAIGKEEINAEERLTSVIVKKACGCGWDVNCSGKVDIFDLVLVGKNFGREVNDGKEPEWKEIGDCSEPDLADVNDDGEVNIFDLVMVGSHFGESVNAAPSHVTKSKSEDLALYRFIYKLLNSYPDKTPKIRLALLELEKRINPVTETRLLANYPNPFNPETWIPYQLRSDGEVKITIYDAVGRLVCVLDLGKKKAGMYKTKSKAVYWNGRNAFGEAVSSGIYFYELRLNNNYVDVRKMVIVR